MKRFLAVLLAAVMLVGAVPAVSLAANDEYATVVGGWLRLRDGASFDAETITSYDTGTQVEIIGRDGSWWLVKTPDGRTGYMYGQYLDFDTTVKPTGTENAYVTSYNGYGVRLRKGPGTGYRVIATCEVGTPVTVLQRGSIWSRINVGGTVGYMMTEFLSYSGSYNPGSGSDKVIDYATIWSSNGYGVRLRTGPGTGYDKIGVYSVGTRVAVLQKGAVWDRIRVGSRVGWMMNEFLYYQGTTEITNVILNNYVPVVGDRLEATVTPSWATVYYQWKRGDDAISGATGRTYLTTDADIGEQISVTVRGYGAYKGERTSAVTSAVGTKIAKPVITSTSLNGAEVQKPYSASLSAQGGGTITWQLISGSKLPDGLTLSTAGQISGTPTQAGSTTFFVVASNSAGTSDAKSFTITVEPKAETPAYTLTIEGSDVFTGLSANAMVSIEAAAPAEGKVFAGWTLVKGEGSFDNANALSTVFHMEGTNATIKAVYNAKSTSTETYDLTVENGSGSAGNLAGDAVVNITANEPASNEKFIGWDLVEGSGNFGNATAMSTTFKMDGEDAKVQALYEAVEEAVTYTLTVTNGTVEGGGASKSGLPIDGAVEITANAAADDMRFSGWTLESGNGNFHNAHNEVTTFYLNGSDAVVRANYETKEKTYTLTVENGSGSDSGLAADATVNISADAPDSGMEFAGWTLVSGYGNFHSSVSQNTTFYMDGSDAIIRATYKEIVPTQTYTLTVENGTVEGSSSKSNLEGDEVLSIKAPARENEEFVGWTLVSGQGNFYNAGSAETTFYMKGSDATIRANYRSKEVVLRTPSVNWSADGKSVSWSSVDGATGYECYRKKADGTETTLMTFTDTSYTFQSAGQPGDIFYVRAVDSSGTAQTSGWGSATY